MNGDWTYNTWTATDTTWTWMPGTNWTYSFGSLSTFYPVDNSSVDVLRDGDGNEIRVKDGKILFRGKDGIEYVLPDELERLRSKNKELETMFDDCFVTG